jgi:hypothetical protein
MKIAYRMLGCLFIWPRNPLEAGEAMIEIDPRGIMMPISLDNI